MYRNSLSYLVSPQASLLIGEPFFRLMMLRKENVAGFHNLNRILVIRLDEIGDVVLISPFLRELRRNLPYAWITLIVNPAVYNLVELCPYVNEVLTYDWNTQGRFWQVKRHWRALELAKKHMWKRRFDLAIIPRFDVDYYHATFLTYFSGASSRIGYSENINEHKKIFNAGYDRLLTHAMTDNALKHEVEHNLDVISYLGGITKEKRLEIWTNSEDEKLSEGVLKTHRVSQKIY